MRPCIAIMYIIPAPLHPPGFPNVKSFLEIDQKTKETSPWRLCYVAHSVRVYHGSNGRYGPMLAPHSALEDLEAAQTYRTSASLSWLYYLLPLMDFSRASRISTHSSKNRRAVRQMFY